MITTSLVVLPRATRSLSPSGDHDCPKMPSAESIKLAIDLNGLELQPDTS